MGCLAFSWVNFFYNPEPLLLGVSLKKVSMLRSQDSLALESRARAIPLPKAKGAPKAKGKGKSKGKEPEPERSETTAAKSKAKPAKPPKRGQA